MRLRIEKVTIFGMLCTAPISTKPKLTTLLYRGKQAQYLNFLVLVDSGASHSFVASKLVKKYQLTVILGTSMVVTLANGNQVTTSKTCSIPIITCTMSNNPVSCMIQCRILPKLLHNLVLGVDWLQKVNLVIDWQSCTLKIDVKGLEDPQYLSVLPVDLVSRVKLCSLQQITKDLKRNIVEEAWLMLLQPHSELVTREVNGHSEARGPRDIYIPSKWNNLV